MKILLLITVFFSFISSDPSFSKCDGWTTVVRTHPPGHADNRILYICGDPFGCSTHHCHIGEEFEIDEERTF
jgi:hypothetical protein